MFRLRWRHNERDGVSNHQPHGCLLSRLFRRRSKKTLKLHVTGPCEGNSPVTGGSPAHRVSNAENASIWWRHHVPGGYIWCAIIHHLFKLEKANDYLVILEATLLGNVWHIEGILPKGPYLPCVNMAAMALLAGYHRYYICTWIEHQSLSHVNAYVYEATGS